MEKTYVRTNYFKVKDGGLTWGSFLSRLSVDGFEKAHPIYDKDGRVGFYAYGEVYGLNTMFIEKEYKEELKDALLEEGRTVIENFLGMDISLHSDDEVAGFMDEALDNLKPAYIRDWMNEYGIGVKDYDIMEDAMVSELRELLMPGEACIIMRVSKDSDAKRCKGSYAWVQVITKEDNVILELEQLAMAKAGKMLNNPDYETTMVH